MRVVQTVFTGHCWRSGEDNVDRRVEVALIDDEGRDVASVGFSEGEPEDMTLNRDLSDAYSITHLVEKAYELGRAGVVVSFESNTEEY